MDHLYSPITSQALKKVLAAHGISQAAIAQESGAVGGNLSVSSLSSFLGGKLRLGFTTAKLEIVLQCLVLADDDPTSPALREFLGELEHRVRAKAFEGRRKGNGPLASLVLKNMEPGESNTQASIRWEREHDVFIASDEIADVIAGVDLSIELIGRLSLVITVPRQYRATELITLYKQFKENDAELIRSAGESL